MDCRVVLEAAIPVYDVEARDAAVHIAIAKTGTMLNPALSYVEITAATQNCPECGVDHNPAFVERHAGRQSLRASANASVQQTTGL